MEAPRATTLLPDAAFPPLAPSPGARPARVAGVDYRAARWTAESLGRLVETLEEGGEALRRLSPRRLRSAWQATVEDFAEPALGSHPAQLRAVLARTAGLSRPGLDAALDHVLRGVSGPGALGLFDAEPILEDRRPAAVLLASNLPGLAVQSLLPALALRRPLLIKSPSSEPFFAPAFVAALAEREPDLGRAVAAVCWTGGDETLERAVFERVGRVVAYGDADTAASLKERLGSRLVMHGPKISLAALDADLLRDGSTEAARSLADGLARDVTLFDQRGCLSVQAVFVLGPGADEAAGVLAEILADALADYGRRRPPGPPSRSTAAGIRQWRDDAVLSGLRMSALAFAAGTVIVTDEPVLRPSPGGRTVRVHALESSEQLPVVLEPWRDRLQGVAVAGERALRLGPRLRELGVSRLVPPGELQDPDLATWHNGGLAPLATFADDPEGLSRS